MTFGPAELDVDGVAPTEGIQATPFASIRRERVQWLLPDRVPLGMLSLLLGDPGLGKSLWTCWLSGIVSRAGAAVLMATAEDSPSATVRPRLEAVRADLERVQLVEVRREGFGEGIALPDDVAILDQLVAEHRARLVVIDPLSAHLAEQVNSWRDQSVRRALAPLARMAAERRCAVIVVAHLNKDKGGDPLRRAGGSIGIPAAARSALLLARDPEDHEGERGAGRILAHVKCNVAPLAESQACRVEPILLAGDEPIKTARLHITGTSEITGSELLHVDQPEKRTARDEAERYLLAELANEPVEQTKLLRHAPCGERTLRKAKASLGVESGKSQFTGPWSWWLPKDAGPISQPVQLSQSANEHGENGKPPDEGCKAAPPQRELSDELAQERAERIAERHWGAHE
jgi:hypothetical protein